MTTPHNENNSSKVKLFHITKKGEPAICNASSPENCPLGSHFSSLQAAQIYSDTINERSELIENYTLTGEVTEKPEEIITKPLSRVNMIQKKAPSEDLTEEQEIDSVEKMSKSLLEETKSLLRDKAILLAWQPTDKSMINKRKLYIKRINGRLGLELLDGLASKEEIEALHAEFEGRKQSLVREEQEAKEKAQRFRELENIELPKAVLLNDIGTYSKSKIVGKCYRGERNGVGNANGGAIFYGRGIYSTTDSKEASAYGDVRPVSADELPSNPLALKTQASFNYLEQSICKQYGIEKRYLYSDDFDVSDLIKKMGYDGLTMGSGKERIVVKYF